MMRILSQRNTKSQKIHKNLKSKCLKNAKCDFLEPKVKTARLYLSSLAVFSKLSFELIDDGEHIIACCYGF